VRGAYCRTEVYDEGTNILGKIIERKKEVANSTGNQLAQSIRRRMTELKRVCEGLDESIASRAPAGRWSPREVLSHLWGPEGSGHLPILQAYLEGENPTIDIDPENPFYSEERARVTFAQLLSAAEAEYGRIAEFAQGLSEAQLDRRAHIPKLKNSPLGEYPTLGNMVSGLGDFHLKFHIDHMREILQDLGVTPK
jgi:hypothetical protein